MRPLCVLITGDPVPRAQRRRGPFDIWVRQGVDDAWSADYLIIDARGRDPLPDPIEVAGVIVTGSPASVTSREPWMERAQRFLVDAVERDVPVLGLCFGHQLLGVALGGRVDKNPRGREIGSVDLEVLAADPMLDGLGARFQVNMTHVDSVLELPSGARVLGRTELEPHAAVRFSEQAWGVQYHPEIDGPTMVDYIEERRELLADEGLAPDALVGRATTTPSAAAVLQRFARHAAERLGRTADVRNLRVARRNF